MMNVSWLPAAVAQASERLLQSLKSLDFTDGSHTWLAVTGLTRSGKTVFITSLIHNLLSSLHNPSRMPLLRVAGDGRLIAAKLEGPKAQRLPRFPYLDNIEAMAGSLPDWPQRTQDVSEIGIDVYFAPAGTLSKLIGQIGGNPAKLSVRIVDYPGEWLLDLPLLSQSYVEWSRSALRLYRRGLRAQAAAPFLAFIGDHPHDEPASEETAKKAHDLYCGFLRQARDQHGLSYLQPGRFLCRGSIGDVPYLWFAPLDCPDHIGVPKSDSLAALMAERFEVYKRELVRRFFENHFRRYSRQIVLVDVLHALLAGREAFEDSRLAIESILQSFRYGSGSLLAKLLHGSHIDKVLFAATKADHVPDVQRDHLAELLRHMAAFQAIEVKSSNAQIDVLALASVVSTTEDVQEIDGQTVPVVVGRPVGARKQARFFVGTVPIRPPRPEAWATPFLNVPAFEPPPIYPSPVDGIPHINLDYALEFLLGDLLQ
jgi:predicted YcjX-like family ATPase